MLWSFAPQVLYCVSNSIKLSRSIVQFIELFFLCLCPRLNKRDTGVKPSDKDEADVDPYSNNSPTHYTTPPPLAASGW